MLYKIIGKKKKKKRQKYKSHKDIKRSKENNFTIDKEVQRSNVSRIRTKFSFYLLKKAMW